jgi:hypothetical protein
MITVEKKNYSQPFLKPRKMEALSICCTSDEEPQYPDGSNENDTDYGE